MDHLPYALDLALSNFYWFPKLKENLRGNRLWQGWWGYYGGPDEEFLWKPSWRWRFLGIDLVPNHIFLVSKKWSRYRQVLLKEVDSLKPQMMLLGSCQKISTFVEKVGIERKKERDPRNGDSKSRRTTKFHPFQIHIYFKQFGFN